MKKLAVVYWSGTGNTQAMAEAVLEGAKEAGAEAQLFTAGEFGPDQAGTFDALAFGCPSMGVEVLEESEFEPMFSTCVPKLGGKPLGLFGSYGWGDGEWMRNWEDECNSSGLTLAHESVICNDAPGDDTKTACKELGAALARA